MIWEQGVLFVVMATSEFQTNSKNKKIEKCAPYWPENIGDIKTYWKIKVHHKPNDSKNKYFILRVFELELNGETKTIYHYQIHQWPDASEFIY